MDIVDARAKRPRLLVALAAAITAVTLGFFASPVSAASAPREPSPAGAPRHPGSLPSSFTWRSSGVLISPHSDSQDIIAVKDPDVVQYRGRWYVAASTVNSSGYSMEFLSFSRWSQAASAVPVYADQTAIGTGYKTSPRIFYFAPRRLWYLIYQTGNNIGYSTNPNIADPYGWSATQYFYSGEPSIISENIGSGYWVDAWTICDRANCYLFSMDDNGHLYRSQTSLADFPDDMTQPVIAASNSDPVAFFEADRVYKVAGTGEYLLLVEAIGSTGHRYLTAYTSKVIDGTWTPLANTQANPFIAESNVTFRGTPWTEDFSSAELIRVNYDQTPTISPCDLRLVYQGYNPADSGDSYNALPWRIGIATQTNSTC
jgi:hypothetical protein